MPTERNRSGRRHRRTMVLRWAAVLLALALIVAGSLALAGRLVGIGPARHSDNQNSSANGPRTASHGPPGYSPEQTAAHPPLTSPVDYNHDGVDDYTAMVRGAHQRPAAILIMTVATTRAAILPMTAAPAPTRSGGPSGRPATT